MNGLCLGQRERDILNPPAFGQKLGLQRILVDLGRDCLERNPRAAQNMGARRTGRGKDEPHLVWPWRSCSKVITVAAVSSTERRETSITGHSCCSKSLRVELTSLRTDSMRSEEHTSELQSHSFISY